MSKMDLNTFYKKNGTIMVNLNESNSPLDDKDLQKLSKYCEEVDKEFIKIGDAGEPNFLNVGRFMTDKEKPEIVDNPYSKKVIEVLNKKELISFIKSVLNTSEDFYYRRIQFNEIVQNCFVGYHLDTDSNPDYLAACVIQLGKDYDGGLYRVYQKDNKNKFIDYKPDFGSVIISNCEYPHEVTKVLKGSRKSLVFFISKHNGLNARYL